MRVKLLFWPGSIGHIALKIYPPGYEEKDIYEKNDVTPNNGIIVSDGSGGMYASYWPDQKVCLDACKCSSDGDLKRETDDKEYYRKLNKERIQNGKEKIKLESILLDDLSKIDINKIIETFIDFNRRNRKGEYNWAAFAECCPRIPCSSRPYKANCSVLVMNLLFKGGIDEYLPEYERFGTRRHLTLLASSRVFIATSTLVYGIYPLIQDAVGDNANPNKAFIGAIIVSLINGLSVFFLEKKYINKRHLIEMSNSDCVVGIAASLGFGLVPLSHRRWISPYMYEHQFNLWQKIVIDFIMIPGSALGLYVFGKLASGIIYVFYGCGAAGYLNHPSNVDRWVKHAIKIKDVDSNVIKVIFKKERCFLSLIYITALVCYAVRKLQFSRENSIYIGIPLGIATNYILTRPFICKFNSDLRKKIEENQNVNERKSIYAVMKKHNPSLEKYSLSCLTTCMGIMLIISLFNRVKIFDPILEGFLSFPGGIIGIGIMIILDKLYQWCCKIRNPGLELLDDSKSANTRHSSIRQDQEKIIDYNDSRSVEATQNEKIGYVPYTSEDEKISQKVVHRKQSLESISLHNQSRRLSTSSLISAVEGGITLIKSPLESTAEVSQGLQKSFQPTTTDLIIG